MKCKNCHTLFEGKFCPSCGSTAQGRLLGFRSGKVWKKILSLMYLVFFGFFSLISLLDGKYPNISMYDFVIGKIATLIFFGIFFTPFLFLSNTKLRSKLPLFKNYHAVKSVIGMCIVVVISMIIFGIAGNLHSEEYTADMSNHAYIIQESEKATCETEGSVSYLCEYCGKTTIETIPAIGHDMEEISRKEPSESSNGEIVTQCRNCGKHKVTVLEKLPSSSHTSISSREVIETSSVEAPSSKSNSTHSNHTVNSSSPATSSKTTSSKNTSSKTTSSKTTATSSSNSSSQSSTAVTVPDQAETVGNLVWVPTNGGKKYHRSSSCSNMDDPMQVSKETAEANGYTPCKRCYK